MPRGPAAISLTLAVAVAIAVSGCGAGSSRVAGHHPSTTPTRSSTANAKAALRALKHSEHATYLAGPATGPAGTFAALGFVPSVYCCRNPHDRLVLLRWSGDAWKRDGQLTAFRGEGGYWEFPNYYLRAHLVAGASAEAPVFLGAVNGTYPTVDVAIIRIHGHWQWARFIGCASLTSCRHRATTWEVSNGVFRGDGLHGFIATCKPDCADSNTQYEETWGWSGARKAFVLTGIKTRHPRPRQ